MGGGGSNSLFAAVNWSDMLFWLEAVAAATFSSSSSCCAQLVMIHVRSGEVGCLEFTCRSFLFCNGKVGRTSERNLEPSFTSPPPHPPTPTAAVVPQSCFHSAPFSVSYIRPCCVHHLFSASGFSDTVNTASRGRTCSRLLTLLNTYTLIKQDRPRPARPKNT